MKINKIVKLKNGKYKLYFDDNIVLTTYDDVILKYNLLYYNDIDYDTYLKLVEDNNFFKFLNKAINYLSKRLRSEKEIIIYLQKRTNDFVLIDSIVHILKDKGLIDDNKFCKAYINDKLNLSNCGIFKIKRELINLGVEEYIIDEHVKQIDFKVDHNKIEKIIKKKFLCNHKYSENFLKQKILNEMVGLGYEKNDVLEILNDYDYDDDEIYNKEYNKIYNRLKNKYQENELDFQVRRRLLAKGFKKK